MAETRTPWTDVELDAALDTLRADVDPDEHVLAGIRANLIAAAERPLPAAAPAAPGRAPRTRRRRARRWLLAPAAATLLAAVVVATQLLPGGGERDDTARAAETLRRAAQLVAARPDEPVARDEYRYVRTHAWVLGGNTGSPRVAVLQEQLREIWQPARFRAEWHERSTITGRERILAGTRAQAGTAGLLSDRVEKVWHGRCRGYTSTRPCRGVERRAGWDFPTQAWIAGLPREPLALYRRLRRDALTEGHGNAHILTTAADALRSGLLPADVRAPLYRALTYVPGLEVSERTATLDGRTGTALGIVSDDGTTRQDIIVDPRTGAFIGERQVQVRTRGGLRAGTVLESTSVTTDVVPATSAVSGR